MTAVINLDVFYFWVTSSLIVVESPLNSLEWIDVENSKKNKNQRDIFLMFSFFCFSCKKPNIDSFGPDIIFFFLRCSTWGDPKMSSSTPVYWRSMRSWLWMDLSLKERGLCFGLLGHSSWDGSSSREVPELNEGISYSIGFLPLFIIYGW